MSYELQPLSPGSAAAASTTSPPLSTHAFLGRVTELNTNLSTLDASIAQISTLHAQVLHSSSDAPETSHSDLDGALTTTHSQIAHIRNALKLLHHDLALTSAWARSPTHRHEQDPSAVSVKTSQLSRLRAAFKSRLVAFQDAEARYRQSHHDQLARQYRIVAPDATDAEIDEFAASNVADAGADVFAQAVLLQGNRRDQANSALAAVRRRHADLELIERTMLELASIMNEVDAMVAQQDEIVLHVEETAQVAEENLEGGTKELAQAEHWAVKLRKHKWICLGISVTIVAVIVLVIVLAVVLSRK